MARYRLTASIAALLLGTAPAAPRDLVLGPVEWQGSLDGLERGHSRSAFQLLAGGAGLLYYQGAPWPRLVCLPFREPSAQPVVVAARVPFPSLPPRVSAAGDAIFFTAAGRLTSLDSAAAREAPLELRVVRVSWPGREEKALHPPSGGAEGSFSVLLDLHPGGETVLVATGRDLRARELWRHDGALELLEIPAAGGPSRRLRLTVHRVVRAEYSADGGRIEYATAPDDADADAQFTYDRAAGTVERVATPERAPRRRAGGVDVSTTLLPHRGSFGWDGFETYAVSPRGGAERLHLRTPAELAALTPLPFLAVDAVGGRILLAGGLQDRPILAVVGLESPVWAEAPRDRAPSPLELHPRFLAGGVLAACSERARELLLRVAASLAATDAPRVRALAAGVRQTGLESAAGSVQRLEIQEELPGRFYARRFFVAEPGAEFGPQESADASPVEPPSQVLAFDGEECWTMTEDGRSMPTRDGVVVLEVNSVSLLRMALDPAGLGDSALRFADPVEAPAGPGGQPRWSLAYRYDDGYRGELLVGESPEGLVPVEWRSPLYFSSRTLELAIGIVPKEKSVAYDDWRRVAGRLVPHRLRFDDGYNPYLLEVVDLKLLDDVDDEVFRMPGKPKQP